MRRKVEGDEKVRGGGREQMWKEIIFIPVFLKYLCLIQEILIL